MTPPGMFGDEGQRVLGDQERDLFPPLVRPAYLRLAWIAVAALAVLAGLLIAAIIGTLS